MNYQFTPYTLQFNFPAGTSRGILREKTSVFIKPNIKGFGNIAEASFIPGLSTDSAEEVMHFLHLKSGLKEASGKKDNLKAKTPPSLQFAIESLPFLTQVTPFSQGESGIRINGLIWMGSIDFMEQQIEMKLQQNYRVIKLKIGAIDWETEHRLLKKIRQKYPKEELELRVDANGAFTFKQALTVLDQLHALDIHSIEQPIAKNQPQYLQKLCAQTPVPIALDEELIGVSDFAQKKELIKTIQPQYLILKPGLLGGFKACEEWIEIAKENNAGYWITSALESNIGLYAIAQWTHQLHPGMPQGLGTGGLFTNNIPSPLEIRGDALFCNPEKQWDFSGIKWKRL